MVTQPFLDMIPKAAAKMTKINKLDSMKIKNLYFKGYHQQSEKQPTEWEEIFERHVTVKGLNLKYIKKYYSSIIKLHIKRWTKDLNKHFSKEAIQVANENMKNCST